MPRMAARRKTFADRKDAGQQLAERLKDEQWTDPLILGLARGGVPVAEVVARKLGAPLDVLVARKIGAPGHPEFGVGAVTSEGPPIFNEETLRMLGLTAQDLQQVCEQERAEARRRVTRYQGSRDPRSWHDRDVIVIDDGLATGVTAKAALRAVREQHPRRLVFAAPVCAPDGATKLLGEADEVVCVAMPEAFMAVGQWYRDFRQTTDDDVVALLEAAHGRSGR
ncbi:MAG: phosphoribosyltransferase [Haloechinothrix sp.]